MCVADFSLSVSGFLPVSGFPSGPAQAALEVSPALFASSWLLSCFAADFPATFAARVLDVVMAERSGGVRAPGSLTCASPS